jgi:ATP-dependent Clp protease protease subunit
MIHQPSGGSRGQATDIMIQAEEILRMKRELNRLLAELSGQPVERLEQDTERDFFMSAEEAKSYGLIDAVMSRRPDGGALSE